ncbi:MAG TPA: rRNA maturation RNase YbeY [Kofleriaceae bacterium]|nr:rRNA maturation RNase YbeY [Kofleriaceae bacterium]
MLSLLVDPEARARLSPTERARLRSRLVRMVRAVGITEGTARELEVSVRLTGDAAIRALNREYRKKNKPTDVLAFAQREADPSGLHPELLGDVVISLDTAARQARRGLLAEVLFLAAHGLCHLLGYDHQTDDQEGEMNARMRALLAEAERRGPTRAA